MRNLGKKFILLTLIVGLIALWAIPSMATVAGAKRTASRIAATFESLGYNVRDSYRYGLLAIGASHTTSTTLYEGSSYVFIAGGDEDVFNVDVRVYDENGVLVARDSDRADVAVAKVTPRWTGTFYIKITMAECAGDGAYWVLVTGQSSRVLAQSDTPEYFKAALGRPTSYAEIASYFGPIYARPGEPLVLDRFGRSRWSAMAIINFDYDSDAIRPESIPLLDEWGRALKGPLARGIFMVEGHTDSKGSATYNQELSERRAWAVKRFLERVHGIPSYRLVARGFGERFPIASNDTAAGQAENRRVQFTLVDWVK